MRTFVEAATAFPTVVFSAALLVVLGYWLLVAFGAASADAVDGFGGSSGFGASGASGGFGGFGGSGEFGGSSGTGGSFGGWGAGGVPVAVGFSIVTALAWFLSLAAWTLLVPPDLDRTPGLLAACALLVAAPVCAWPVARLLVRPLAPLFSGEPGPSRQDFVGLTCTIRTGRVDAGFGQAEVAAEDGSTALVQVRQPDGDPSALTLGATGLLYAYEADGEFFWVTPFDAALDWRSPSL